jgi:hypothetical protein
MSTKNGLITGAAVGAGIAVVMISLDNLRPFSVAVNSFIDRAAFIVCPLYVLGFSNDIPNKAVWYLVTILGNAVLYGAVFGGLAGLLSLFKRSSVA